MVSTLRRKSRAYCLAPRKANSRRSLAGNPVRGLIRLWDWISTRWWYQSWDESPWQDAVASAYGFQLRSFVLACPWGWFCERYEAKGASERAEKSRRSRRRLRGLRKGKRRSRERHSRRTAPDRQPEPKALSSRKELHSFRKEQWALRASNKLRLACERFNRMPVVHVDSRLETERRLFYPWMAEKTPDYWRKYRRDRAAVRLTHSYRSLKSALTKVGLPADLWLHDSFREWRMIETSTQYSDEFWCKIVEGLPLPPYEPRQVVVHHEFGGRGHRVVIRHYTTEDRLNTLPVRNRTCRMCGFIGPDPHEWNACRVPREVNKGWGSKRQGKGKQRGRTRY